MVTPRERVSDVIREEYRRGFKDIEICSISNYVMNAEMFVLRAFVLCLKETEREGANT